MDVLYNCAKCNKPVTQKYGSGKFCSASCAHSHSFTLDQLAYKGKRQSEAYRAKHNGLKPRPSKVCSICGSIDCDNPFCKNGHKKQQITTLITYFGFTPEALGTSDVFAEWDRVRNVLYKLYHIDGLSSTDIAKKYNYPSPCNLPGKVFKYLGIERKDNSQATLENHTNGKLPMHKIHTRYKSGWHKTWYGDSVYLRSSYEYKLADLLDEKKVYYQVEFTSIPYVDTDGRPRIAIPDFYIPHANLIIEVKSSYTLNAPNTLAKAKSYLEKGYNFKLYLENELYDITYLENL